MKQSQRTIMMKENYKRLHDEGLSPKEIAEKFGISQRNLYSRLSEIAEMNGVSREDLLAIPHKTHAKRGKSSCNSAYIFDITEVTTLCEDVKSKALNLSNRINEVLKGEKQNGKTN